MSVLPIPTDVGNIHPKVQSLYTRLQYAQRTPEWYEVRRGLITASEAAAAMGIKPFAGFKGCPREELMQTKLNKPKSFSGMAMQHGVHYETEACDYAMDILGKKNLEFGLLVHPEFPWLAASPDGITTDGMCVEIKCPLLRKIVPGEVPHHYQSQLQIQMEVCNIDETLFIQYRPAHMTEDGNPYVDITRVARDREWFANHRDTLKNFWEEMQDRRKSHIPREGAPDENVLEIDDELYVKDKEYVREFVDDVVIVGEIVSHTQCSIVDDLFEGSKDYERQFSDDVFLTSMVV
jgi:putative phage-type endonuclease